MRRGPRVEYRASDPEVAVLNPAGARFSCDPRIFPHSASTGKEPNKQ